MFYQLGLANHFANGSSTYCFWLWADYMQQVVDVGTLSSLQHEHSDFFYQWYNIHKHNTANYSTFSYTCVRSFITYPWWPYFDTQFAAMQLQCPLHTRVSDDNRVIHQTLPSFPSPAVHRMIIQYLISSNRKSHLCLIPLSQFVQS